MSILDPPTARPSSPLDAAVGLLAAACAAYVDDPLDPGRARPGALFDLAATTAATTHLGTTHAGTGMPAHLEATHLLLDVTCRILRDTATHHHVPAAQVVRSAVASPRLAHLLSEDVATDLEQASLRPWLGSVLTLSLRRSSCSLTRSLALADQVYGPAAVHAAAALCATILVSCASISGRTAAQLVDRAADLAAQMFEMGPLLAVDPRLARLAAELSTAVGRDDAVRFAAGAHDLALAELAPLLSHHAALALQGVLAGAALGTYLNRAVLRLADVVDLTEPLGVYASTFTAFADAGRSSTTAARWLRDRPPARRGELLLLAAEVTWAAAVDLADDDGGSATAAMDRMVTAVLDQPAAA